MFSGSIHEHRSIDFAVCLRPPPTHKFSPFNDRRWTIIDSEKISSSWKEDRILVKTRRNGHLQILEIVEKDELLAIDDQSSHISVAAIRCKRSSVRDDSRGTFRALRSDLSRLDDPPF